MSDFLCMYCGLILKNRLEGQMHEDGHRGQIKLNKEKEPVMTDKRISCFNMIKTLVGNKPTVHTCESVIFKTNSNDANCVCTMCFGHPEIHSLVLNVNITISLFHCMHFLSCKSYFFMRRRITFCVDTVGHCLMTTMKDNCTKTNMKKEGQHPIENQYLFTFMVSFTNNKNRQEYFKVNHLLNREH